MADQPDYWEDTDSGDIFFWSNSRSAFVNRDDAGHTISRTSPDARRLTRCIPRYDPGPRITQARPVARRPSAASSSSIGGPAFQNYTYNAHQSGASVQSASRWHAQASQAVAGYRSSDDHRYGPGVSAFPPPQQDAGPRPDAYGIPYRTTYAPEPPAFAGSSRSDYNTTSGASISRSVQPCGPYDHRFKFREHRFFKLFRVLILHWPEIDGGGDQTNASGGPGSVDQGSSVVAFSRYPGERIISKLRWFAIIKAGTNYCHCVRIVTYGGQGLAKPGIVKSDHAIAYTREVDAHLFEDERPRNEASPQVPIRIEPDETGDMLLPRARIDYSRIYTVEHNVKARSFGMIHSRSKRTFWADWHRVNGFEVRPLPPNASRP